MASQKANDTVDSSGGKFCFVTIGATAGFDSLVRAVLDAQFIRALEGHGYTDLIIQHGKDEGGIYRSFAGQPQDLKNVDGHLRVTGFDFNKAGLGQEMKGVKGNAQRKEGVVISHAGKAQQRIYFQRLA